MGKIKHKGKTQAVQAVENLPAHNYRAGEAVRSAGYALSTSQKKAGEVINRGLRDIARLPKKERDTLLSKIGISSEEYAEALRSIVRQDKDRATKFKALQALAKYTDIDLSTENESTASVPEVHITFSKIETPPQTLKNDNSEEISPT